MNTPRFTPWAALAALTFTACSKSPDPAPAPPPPPPPPTAEAIAAAQAAQAAYEERRARAAGFFSVEFKTINEAGYPMFTVTNLTGKDVDDMSGGFEGSDPDGNVLFATGHTVAVPGEVFLRAGESTELSPYNLLEKEAPMALLRSNPSALKVVFRVRSLTYMDGTAEADLE